LCEFANADTNSYMCGSTPRHREALRQNQHLVPHQRLFRVRIQMRRIGLSVVGLACCAVLAGCVVTPVQPGYYSGEVVGVAPPPPREEIIGVAPLRATSGSAATGAGAAGATSGSEVTGKRRVPAITGFPTPGCGKSTAGVSTRDTGNAANAGSTRNTRDGTDIMRGCPKQAAPTAM
jgi:hypothetical protein